MTTLPYKTIKRMMKENTDYKITKEAVQQVQFLCETLLIEVTQESSKYTTLAKRKTVNLDDINLAINNILGINDEA